MSRAGFEPTTDGLKVPPSVRPRTGYGIPVAASGRFHPRTYAPSTYCGGLEGWLPFAATRRFLRYPPMTHTIIVHLPFPAELPPEVTLTAEEAQAAFRRLVREAGAALPLIALRNPEEAAARPG